MNVTFVFDEDVIYVLQPTLTMTLISQLRLLQKSVTVAMMAHLQSSFICRETSGSQPAEVASGKVRFLDFNILSREQWCHRFYWITNDYENNVSRGIVLLRREIVQSHVSVGRLIGATVYKSSLLFTSTYIYISLHDFQPTSICGRNSRRLRIR